MNTVLLFSACTILFFSLFCKNQVGSAEPVGVNYGLNGNNLPSPAAAVYLMQFRGIRRARLFEPNLAVVQAFCGSGIELVLGTLNQDLPQLASDPSFAMQWVNTNIVPFAQSVDFRYVVAGNEVIPGDLAVCMFPALKNLDAALKAARLAVPVTTAVPSTVLGESFPPSKGQFSNEVNVVMTQIVSFLAANKYPLLFNCYPYFSYVSDPADISSEYALFTSEKVEVSDGNLEYKNLFDAMVDALYAAMEKVGGSKVTVVVSESGWPSGGGDGQVTTVDNASTYNNKLVAHVSGTSGTPRRPGTSIEAYIFALFNENQKPEGVEQNFGLFTPNMEEVYHMNNFGN